MVSQTIHIYDIILHIAIDFIVFEAITLYRRKAKKNENNEL